VNSIIPNTLSTHVHITICVELEVMFISIVGAARSQDYISCVFVQLEK